MKKAKILLTAICMFAIVGGALAYKTNEANRGWRIFCAAAPALPGFCTITVDDYDITTVVTTILKGFCTRNPFAACPGFVGLVLRI